MTITVLLADNHLLIREGLKKLLENDGNIKIVAEASDGYECLNFVNKKNPDIVLMDTDLICLDGFKVLSIMRDNGLNNKVIFLTTHVEVDYMIKAIELGCDGYILKNSDIKVLKKAIIDVNNNLLYIEPKLRDILNSSLAKRDNKKDKISNLTKKELSILKMIAQGFGNKDISEELCISERTVKNHVSNILKKLDVNDRTQAAVLAIKCNLVNIR